VFPANSPVIRPATAHDAIALRRLAAVSDARPLAGGVLVAEARGVRRTAVQSITAVSASARRPRRREAGAVQLFLQSTDGR
jgi:hypothetical protein